MMNAGIVTLALLLFLLGVRFPHVPRLGSEPAVVPPTWLAEDGSAKLGLAEVLAGELAFKPMPSRRLSLGATDSAFWLRIQVDNPEPIPVTRWLTVGIPRLHHVTLFQQRNGAWSARDSGMAQPFGDRDTRTVTPAFTLELPAHSSQEVLVRIASTTLLLVQPQLWQPLDLAVAEERQAQQEYFGAGATLLMLVVCLLLAIMLRSPGFLIFALTALAYQLFRWSASGLAFRELWPDSPAWAMRSVGFFMALLGLLMVLLHRYLLETARHFPRADRALNLLLLGFALLAGAALLTPGREAIMALMLWGLLVSLASPVLGLMAWRRGVPLFGYCLAGYALPWHLIEFQYFSSMGWLPFTRGWLLEYNRAWAMLLSAVIILTALGARVRRMRQEQERAERNRLTELETAVAQRTVELQAAKEMAEEAMADQQRLLDMVSHECRTPLANVSAATQLLELSCHTPEQLSVLARIQRASARLGHFLDNCLANGRLAAGGWSLNERRFAVSGLLSEALEHARQISSTHRFRLVAPPQLPEMQGDSQLLHVLLHNLLENAIKYSPPDSDIELCARTQADGRLLLSVKDRGRGIAEQDLGRVFEKFYRSEQAGGVSGAGLGLYLVRRIALLHEATVTACNRRSGGSCFELLFPAQRVCT